LGYSHLRLLPKEIGARPITNLRRRQIKQISGRRVLGSSINAQLTPLFNVLNYENLQIPSRLGSAMLSVGDLHDRLAQFRKRLPPGSRLHFVKVDIRSCFDNIPQEHLLEVVQRIFGDPAYRSTRHTEFKAVEQKSPETDVQVKKRFIGTARPADDRAVFSEAVATSLAGQKRRVVFADTGNHRTWTTSALLKLLRDHVQHNMVKVGKKHMIQKDGIPQGSVLSSLLCSYFYGAFESQELGFLDPRSSLLLRLIDDFLLITTDENIARRFLAVMVDGDQRYGISVNPGKSLVNFDVTVEGTKIPRLHGRTSFPYCGLIIDTSTLELAKDRDKKDAHIRNALTVDSCVHAGIIWRRKIMSALKLQMHAMLVDLSLNNEYKVMSTLLGNFTETAMKMHQYMASLSASKRPSQGLIISLVKEMIVVATKICAVKNEHKRSIGRMHMCWIGATAFDEILSRKQSQYAEVLVWLRSLKDKMERKMVLPRRSMDRMISENERTFVGYVY
jgi:telomerase reverse transcriptase